MRLRQLNYRHILIAIAGIFGIVPIGHLLYILVLNKVFYLGLFRARVAVLLDVVRLTVDMLIPIQLFLGQYISIHTLGDRLFSNTYFSVRSLVQPISGII